MGRIASSSPNFISSSAGGGGGTEDGLFLSLMKSPSMNSWGGLTSSYSDGHERQKLKVHLGEMNVTTLSALASWTIAQPSHYDRAAPAARIGSRSDSQI